MKVNLLNLTSKVKWTSANGAREVSTAPIINTFPMILMLAWCGSDFLFFFEVVQAN
jgi:hypothetical protein